MIVHPVGDSAEIVMQVDHSLVAGELAELWSDLEPRDSMLVAAALHDCGWRAWEAAPRLDPRSARPENFLDVEIDLHLQFYATAIAEVTARDRYAGMLVAKHLTGIYRQRYGTQAALKITRAPAVQTKVDAFVGEIEQLFGALQRELGVSDEEFWRNYVLLQVFDRLSLWLCRGDPAGTGSMRIVLPDGGELAVEPTAEGCSLSPYPLGSEPAIVSVPVRVVPLSGYADDADCAARILAAPVERRSYRITAG